jgi:hypothetical protein
MQQPNRLLKMVFVLMYLSTVITFYSYGAVPQEINYQGHLTDATGSPVDGMLDMTFKIYNVDAGGTALWTETQLDVEVTNGVYHVQIGSVVALPYNIFEDDRYLGISIETDSEMTPRQKITSSAYAIKAQDAVTLQGHSPGDFADPGHSHDFSDLTGAAADADRNGLLGTVHGRAERPLPDGRAQFPTRTCRTPKKINHENTKKSE